MPARCVRIPAEGRGVSSQAPSAVDCGNVPGLVRTRLVGGGARQSELLPLPPPMPSSRIDVIHSGGAPGACSA